MVLVIIENFFTDGIVNFIDVLSLASRNVAILKRFTNIYRVRQWELPDSFHENYLTNIILLCYLIQFPSFYIVTFTVRYISYVDTLRFECAKLHRFRVHHLELNLELCVKC